MTIRGGDNGDTFEAIMSVCNPTNGMHHMFTSVLPLQLFAPQPTIGYDAAWDEADTVKSYKPCYNYTRPAIILESIVQGAGEMRPTAM